MQADGNEAGSVEVSVRWRHPYRRMRLLSPQSSTDSIADLKQEETEHPLQKSVITVTTAPISIATAPISIATTPISIATATQSAHGIPAALVGPTKDSPRELPAQAKNYNQLPSRQQELTEDVKQKQTSVPPESNNPSPKQPLDHGQLPHHGEQEGEEPIPVQNEGSLTLTEISDGEEEIEEELTEVSEDTVFEETLPTTGK